MAEKQSTPFDTEIWKPVTDWEGYYEVSNHGRVRSLPRVIQRKNGIPCSVSERILQTNSKRHKYPQVHLRKPGKNETRYVHELVLLSFVGPRPPGFECCHWDDDPHNNYLDNLRWDTSSSNSYDIVRNGNNRNSNRTHCPQGHPLVKPNLTRSKNPNHRGQCISCSRARAYLQKHKELKHHMQKISDSYFQKLNLTQQETK